MKLPRDLPLRDRLPAPPPISTWLYFAVLFVVALCALIGGRSYVAGRARRRLLPQLAARDRRRPRVIDGSSAARHGRARRRRRSRATSSRGMHPLIFTAPITQGPRTWAAASSARCMPQRADPAGRAALGHDASAMLWLDADAEIARPVPAGGVPARPTWCSCCRTLLATAVPVLRARRAQPPSHRQLRGRRAAVLRAYDGLSGSLTRAWRTQDLARAARPVRQIAIVGGSSDTLDAG